MRIGHGYDVHKLVRGRKLILGGVDIAHEKGLLGHSDADVLVHSVMDAVLGALALGDIGRHFPDTDHRYKGVNSLFLLDKVYLLMEEKGYRIGNLDVTVIAQQPKLAPYIDEMRRKVSDVLRVSVEEVNIKATTEEHLGFSGREEGIRAHSVVLLAEKERT